MAVHTRLADLLVRAQPNYFLFRLLTAVGNEICILKTHCDVVSDWTPATAERLRLLADEVGGNMAMTRRRAENATP